jgi:heme/copper-type cytochrome/quinol oxidase subunit 2
MEVNSVEGNHTFTIDALGVDVDLKPGVEQVVQIDNAQAGEYVFYSKNSTDVENNMQGLLVVK